MKKNILITILTGFMACAQAQILHPVKWSYTAIKTTANTADVFIKATIEGGWHIYSVHQEDGGPVKTSFSFIPSENYELVGDINEPKPQNEFSQAFAMKVFYFKNLVIFQQKITLSKSPTVVKGSLRFMVCNDQKCLPPEDVTFEIPIKSTEY